MTNTISITPYTDAASFKVSATGQELCPSSAARYLERDRDKLADELEAAHIEIRELRMELHSLQNEFLTKPRRY